LRQFNRFKQRPLDEVIRPEQIALKLCRVGAALQLERTDVKHLACVIPLLDGAVHVQPLEALKPYERTLEKHGERLGDLRLAHAGFAFKQKRLVELEHEENRGGQRAVGNVGVLAERLLQFVNRLEFRGHVHLTQSAALSQL